MPMYSGGADGEGNLISIRSTTSVGGDGVVVIGSEEVLLAKV